MMFITYSVLIYDIFFYKSWRGYRDDALSEITRVPDCIFVHAGGFIGGK